MTIGKMIRDLRRQKGYTQEDFGRLVGVGKSTVAKWEGGEIANIRVDKIPRIAEVLGVEVGVLTRGMVADGDPRDASVGEFMVVQRTEQEVIRLFDSMSEQNQQLALSLLRQLADKGQ